MLIYKIKKCLYNLILFKIYKHKKSENYGKTRKFQSYRLYSIDRRSEEIFLTEWGNVDKPRFGCCRRLTKSLRFHLSDLP
jgi:hypothetical protein